MFGGGERTKMKGSFILPPSVWALSLAIRILIFQLLAVHGIERNPGPGMPDENKKTADAFCKVIKRFTSMQQFKMFAQSGCGLVLSYQDVNDITEHSTESVKYQKRAFLNLWKEKNGRDEAAENIEQVTKDYFEARKQKIVPGERFEDVFPGIIETFQSIDEFKRFALSQNGLALCDGDVTAIEQDKTYRLDRMLSMLWLWKQNEGDSATTGRILEIVENYNKKKDVKKERFEDQSLTSERFEDVYFCVIDKFKDLAKFKHFARSSYGLSLDENNVATIDQDKKHSVDKKLGLLKQWKQNAGELATTKNLMEIVEKYENIRYESSRTSRSQVEDEPSGSRQIFQSRGNPSVTVDTFSGPEREFIQKVQANTYEATEYDVRMSFKELQKLEHEIQPKLNIFDLGRQTGNQQLGVQSMGTDETQICIDQIHEEFKGSKTNHVMLLGEAGAGKTISAMKYARLVSEGKVRCLRNTKMTLYVSVPDLQYENISNVFDLLFTQQIGIPDGLKEAGARWVEENAENIVLVLDGLDQAAESFGGRYPKIADPKFKGKTNTILANVLSGSLYPGMKILSTARWQTFWDLDPNQNPSKVVVLKGFSDDDVSEVLSDLVVSNALEQAIQYELINTPSVISLCKNPMFLMYMAVHLQFSDQTEAETPNTTSGIMVSVLNYFTKFNYSNTNIRNMMKLAFNGIRGNIFSFPIADVENLGLNISYLGILVPTRNIQEPNMHVKFLHQSIQELLAAFHLLNFEENEFDNFISTELNDQQWENTRNFLYGIVLNPMTNKFSERYIPDEGIIRQKSSLESQIKNFLHSGTILDINIVSILHECGPDVISQFKNLIKRFEVSLDTWMVNPMSAMENYALAFVSNKSLPLEHFKADLITLDSNTLQLMYDSSKFVDVMKMKYVGIGKEVSLKDYKKLERLLGVLEIEVYVYLRCDELLAQKLLTSPDMVFKGSLSKLVLQEDYSAKIIRSLGKQKKYSSLGFVSSNFTAEKLRILKEAFAQEVEVQMFLLGREDKLGTGFYELAEFLSNAKTKDLAITACNLTVGNIDSFARGAADCQLQLNTLDIQREKVMDPDAYIKLANAVANSNVSSLGVFDCDITEEKLQSFNKTARTLDISIKSFTVQDKKSEAPLYCELAKLASNINLESLKFVASNLTNDKLDSFLQGASEHELKLKKLMICEEKSMDRDEFYKFAQIVSATKSETLAFKNCTLTNEKLESFGRAASSHRVKLNALHLAKENSMKSSAFEKLAEVTSITETKLLLFANNNITSDKLDAFVIGASEKQIQLDQLVIQEETSMEPADFCKFAQVASVTKPKTLVFQNCNLTTNKLESFEKGAIDNKLSLNELNLTDENLMKPEAFRMFAQVASTTHTESIHINNCILTTNKLHSFSQGALDRHLKLKQLEVQNESMNPSAFRKLAQVASVTNPEVLVFNNCDLTTDKLESFSHEASEFKLKLNDLVIRHETSMNSLAFHTLAEVAAVTNPEALVFNNCELRSDKLQSFERGALEHDLKLDQLVIQEETSMKPADFCKFAQVASVTKPNTLVFKNCNLSTNKLESFEKGAIDNKLSLNNLLIDDEKSMKPATFRKFAQVASTTNTECLIFTNNDLTSDKLDAFAEEASDNCLKLNKLILFEEKSMKPAAFRKLAQVASTTNTEIIVFNNNDLTSDKLEAFARGAADNRLKLHQLTFERENTSEFSKLAQVASVTRPDDLSFDNCDVTYDKLDSFAKGALNYSLKLNELNVIEEKSMKPAAFRKLAQVASTTNTEILVFNNNDLTNEKLDAFAEGAADNRLKLHQLIIQSENTSTFSKLALVASVTRPDVLSFFSCDLTYDKLDSFAKEVSDHTLKLYGLNIIKEKSMKPAAFRKLAQVASTTNTEILVFSNNDLTSDKLEAFAKGAADNRLKLNSWNVMNEKSMKPAAFRKLAQVASTTNTDNLVFTNNDLTSDKLDAFAEGAADNRLKLHQLSIQSENTSTFSKLALVASVTRPDVLSFVSCDLTYDKLDSFAKEVSDHTLKLYGLNIITEKSMKPAAFRKLAQVASTTNTEILVFSNNDLTSDKLEAFAKGAADNRLKLNSWNVMNEKSMKPAAFRKLAQVASTTNTDILVFTNNDLTSDKLDAFAEGAADNRLKLHILIIQRENTSAFRKLAQIASVTRPKVLSFDHCDVTCDKLNSFTKGASDHMLKLNGLNVNEEKSMKPTAFRKLAQVASTTNTEILIFTNNDLTSDKLEAFARGAADNRLKLHQLTFERENTSEFTKLAQVASVTRPDNLSFDNCDVTYDKLDSFAKGALNYSLKLNGLNVIEEKSMKPAAFRKLAQVASTTNIEILKFINNDLTNEKLDAFAEGAADNRLKLYGLNIITEKSMKPAAFRKLAQVASTTNTDNLVFTNNDLTSDKLEAFAKGAADNRLKLNSWNVMDEKSMKPAAFRKLAQVASTTNTDILVFTNNDLTSDKLDAFAEGAADNRLKLHQLIIQRENTSAFCKLAQVASVTRPNVLSFDNCDVTCDKLNSFTKGASDHMLKLNGLNIQEKSMKPAAFRKLPQVASTTNIKILIFTNNDLTNAKLDAFAKGAADNRLKLHQLIIQREKTSAFRKLAQVASVTRLDVLSFDNCDVTYDKLDSFAKGASDFTLKLKAVVLRNEISIEPPSFGKFAQAASITNLDSLILVNCNLTSDKLDFFAKGALDHRLKLTMFQLGEDKFMDPLAFKKLAEVVSVTRPEKFLFMRGRKTKDKLNAFAHGAAEKRLKLDTLQFREVTMKPSAFCELSRVASITKPNILEFIECNLTSEKLDSFAQEASNIDLKLKVLALDDKSMEPSVFGKLAYVASITKPNGLSICNCSLTCAKLDWFAKGASESGLKLPILMLKEHFKPSRDIIRSVCGLFHAVKQKLILSGWDIDQSALDVLQTNKLQFSELDIVTDKRA
ncbi:uncharacterized protein LOC120326569 isoform X2 [Styela clava]